MACDAGLLAELLNAGREPPNKPLTGVACDAGGLFAELLNAGREPPNKPLTGDFGAAGLSSDGLSLSASTGLLSATLSGALSSTLGAPPPNMDGRELPNKPLTGDFGAAGLSSDGLSLSVSTGLLSATLSGALSSTLGAPPPNMDGREPPNKPLTGDFGAAGLSSNGLSLGVSTGLLSVTLSGALSSTLGTPPPNMDGREPNNPAAGDALGAAGLSDVDGSAMLSAVLPTLTGRGVNGLLFGCKVSVAGGDGVERPPKKPERAGGGVATFATPWPAADPIATASATGTGWLGVRLNNPRAVEPIGAADAAAGVAIGVANGTLPTVLAAISAGLRPPFTAANAGALTVVFPTTCVGVASVTRVAAAIAC